MHGKFLTCNRLFLGLHSHLELVQSIC